MPELALPEEILQIIWKRLYSDNVVSSICTQAIQINKNLQNLYFYRFALEPFDYQPLGTCNLSRM